MSCRVLPVLRTIGSNPDSSASRSKTKHRLNMNELRLYTALPLLYFDSFTILPRSALVRSPTTQSGPTDWMGKPRILDVRVAFMITCPHSSGLGITKSRMDEKSKRT